jgi:hypothetical protein
MTGIYAKPSEGFADHALIVRHQSYEQQAWCEVATLTLAKGSRSFNDCGRFRRQCETTARGRVARPSGHDFLNGVTRLI